MASQPDTYTHGHQDSVLRAHRWRTAANSAAYLLPHLRPGDRLLDVGCGPGTLTADLGRHVPQGRVTGIDVIAAVVGEAEAHAREAGVDNVAFVTGDFRDAGLERASYDVVHAHQVLQHLREPVGALAAMARLAAPGGLVAARDADYSSMTWAPENDGIRRWLDVYLAVARRNGAEPNAGRWLPRWAHAAGLANATYSTTTWTFATPGDRAYWGGQWSDRAVASSFAEQAVAYGFAKRSELEGIAGAWLEWAAEPDGVFTVVHGEILARVAR
jgi:ubiquinone/menaquinone biosynthesis C-methylase UbiE